MERIERLVVHVEEAIRLSEARDVARLRLSLLLLDSAAELMLHRETEERLMWEEPLRRQLANLEAYEKNGLELSPEQSALRGELRARVTSNTKRNKIRNDFNAKVDLLSEAGVLPEGQVRCLRKLHKYRNDAYHNDHVRDGSLRSAVRIYTYLVCEMMRKLTPSVITTSMPGHLPITFHKYLSTGESHDDLQAKIAKAMLERVRLSGPADIGRELSEHLVSRIQEINEALEFVADHLSSVRRRDGRWDSEDALKLIQGRSHLPRWASLDEIRALKTPVSQQTMQAWRSSAERLAGEADPVAAFSKFADIEDAFEAIESEVMDVAFEVELAIQNEIDRLRGK